MYDRIRELCNEAGITIQTLEVMAGLSNGSIGKWRTSMPRADVLARVATILNTTTEYLLNGDGPAHPPQGNITEFIVSEDGELAEYLQKIKDEEGIMFDLSKVASLDEIKATVAFIKTLRRQGGNRE